LRVGGVQGGMSAAGLDRPVAIARARRRDRAVRAPSEARGGDAVASDLRRDRRRRLPPFGVQLAGFRPVRVTVVERHVRSRLFRSAVLHAVDPRGRPLHAILGPSAVPEIGLARRSGDRAAARCRRLLGGAPAEYRGESATTPRADGARRRVPVGGLVARGRLAAVTVICEARARLWRRFVVGVPEALVCGLGLTSSASGQFADSGVKSNGPADDTTIIGRANAAAGAQTVVLSPGICRITSNVTLTAMLHFASGTQFAIERGVTVTIQGELVAPLRRIFSGAGSVIFDNSRVVPVLHPEWWGAVHDGTTDDSRAIQAAVHAVSAGQVIELQTGVYAVGTALSIDRSLTL